MIDLGIVRPGSTIRIPFSSFDKDDGSSITMTNFAAADILVYKDGGTTERASTAGFTATTDFDGKIGKQLVIIDLADNTTAGFWNAGSEYLVAIDAVTVDAVVTGGWIARFRIGYPNAILNTTIATLSSQTSFTLTSGPAEDDAINDMWAVIHDLASAVQFAKVLILDYTGSTKTVALAAGATFTVAAGDNFSLIDLAPLQVTALGNKLDVSAGGEAGLDWANIGGKTTANDLTGTNIKTDQKVDLNTIKTQTVTAAGAVAVLASVGTAATSTAQTGDNFARLGAPAGASVSADIAAAKVDTAAVKAKTDNLPSDPADASVLAGRFDTLDTAVAALPTNAELGTALGTADDAVLAALASVLADTDDIQNRLPAVLDANGLMKSNAIRIHGIAMQGDGSVTPIEAA